MKILYHHRTRGTDAQRVHILEMVNAFRSLGHELEIVSLVDPQSVAAHEEAGEPGWKKLVRRIPFAYELVQIGYNLVGVPMLLRKARHREVAFIYERYSLFNFAGVLSARLARKPLVLEVNSPFAVEQAQERAIRASRFAAWTERVICNAASAVLVVSGPLRRMMIESGVAPARLVLMPNGANLGHFKAEPAETERLRAALGLTGKTVIGFAGWFKQWHGLEFLLESFQEAGLAGRGAVLLLIGDGPAAAGLKSYVAAKRLEGSVVFSGPVAHENIAPYLQAIDIAVQPSANAYCCPMKILEYMALAKPIVAPRQENIQELLEDGNEAMLFAPGDKTSLSAALARLVDDGALREAIGKRALEAIHRRGLLWERNAERVVELALNAARV